MQQICRFVCTISASWSDIGSRTSDVSLIGISGRHAAYNDPIQKVTVQFIEPGSDVLIELIAPADEKSPVSRFLDSAARACTIYATKCPISKRLPTFCGKQEVLSPVHRWAQWPLPADESPFIIGSGKLLSSWREKSQPYDSTGRPNCLFVFV